MADYTEAFACFILECKDAYQDLCQQIDAGNVPAGQQATIRITLPASAVDSIRADRLAATASVN